MDLERFERLRREAESSPSALQEYARQVFRREGVSGLLQFVQPGGLSLPAWFRAMIVLRDDDPRFFQSGGVKIVFEDFVLPLSASTFCYAKRKGCVAHFSFDGLRLCSLERETAPVVSWSFRGARECGLRYAHATLSLFDTYKIRRRTARFCVFCIAGKWGVAPRGKL